MAITFTTSAECDLTEILAWLKREHKRKRPSFWVNRESIERAHRERRLVVLRENNKAVAFHTHAGLLQPDSIFVVHPELRGRGYGKILARHCIREAHSNDTCFLRIKCFPQTSIPFWETMGFKLLPDRNSPGSSAWDGYTYPYAHMTLPKEFDLPAGCHDVSVLIQFYSDGEQGASDAQPLSEHRPRACYLKDGRIALERRVIGFYPSEMLDLVVKIDVESNTLCFKRARYAVNFGVRQSDAAFYLDVITPEPPADAFL
jgi:GNAT superfamily N-acetyltransferase